MRLWLVTTALVVSVFACLFTLLDAATVAVVVLLGIWFTLPGAAIVGRAYVGTRHATWLLAPTLGYIASSLVVLAFWACGARGLWVIVVAPAIAAGLGWAGAGLLRGLVESPEFTRRDALALVIVLFLVPATVGPPYARVGDVPPGHEGGEAYRAYFTADVVWAMAAVSEVSKGDFPPRNPFRLGATLHYYWLAHLFPAVEHRALPATPLRSLLLANAVLSGLAFVAFLYLFARHFTERPWAAAAGVACALWATSFEGLQQLVALWVADRPLSLVRYVNIDAVTRWVFQGMPVDGLQRLLMYQPQHQLGYASAFASLILVLQARRVAHMRLGAVVGLTLAGSLLLSTFSALMMTMVVAVVIAGRIVCERAWRAAVLVALAAAVPLILAVLLANTLQYVEHGEGTLVSVIWNTLAFHRWPAMLTLSMGPVWIATAVLLVMLALRRHASSLVPRWPLAVLVAVSLTFYFFADVRDHEHVYVGWRAGHLIFIGFAALMALTVDILADLTTRWRVGVAALLCAATVAALPTTVIDLYNTQDISNFEMASTFHWTTWLSPDEVDGLRWLREQTPSGAIVQMDTRAHGTETWAYIPAFGERRMAAGVPISMIPLARYLSANARVVEVFDAPTAGAVAELMARNGIDYLWLGPGEQRRRPDLLPMLLAAPERCRAAYASQTVAVVSCQ